MNSILVFISFYVVLFVSFLFVAAWVHSGYSSFPNMHARQIGNSKLSVDVCENVNGHMFVCLSMWPCNELTTCSGWNLAFAL